MLKGSAPHKNHWHSSVAVFGLTLASIGGGCTTSVRERGVEPSASKWTELAAARDPLSELPGHFGIDLSRGGDLQFCGDGEADFAAMTNFLGVVQTRDLCGVLSQFPEAARGLWEAIEGQRLSTLKATLLLSYLASHMSEVAPFDAKKLACSEFIGSASDREVAQYCVLLGKAYSFGYAREAVDLACKMDEGAPLLMHTDSSGHTFLANLYGLVTSEHIFEPLKPYRERALFDLIELAVGETILDQGERRTCGSTAMLLVLNDVPEMARLTLGLLSPEGKVTLRGGQALVRTPDWDRNGGGGGNADRGFASRGVAQALMQAALMDLGNGSLWRYRDSADANLFGILPIPGLMPDDARVCLEQLKGQPYETTHNFARWLSAQEGASQEVMIPVVIHLEGLNFHWLAVERVWNGEVYFCDPNGREGSEPDGKCDRYESFPMSIVVDSAGRALPGKFKVSYEELRDKFFAAVIPVR